MQFEFDPESLIEAVKKRPGIWDPEHEHYKNKKARVKMWSDIVKELIHADANASVADHDDTRELEFQLQTKWKSLRDRLIKYVSHPNQKRPYIYAKQMQFLLKKKELPKISSAKENGSVGSTEDEEDDKPTWKLKKKVKLDYDEKLSNGGDGSENDYDPLIPGEDYVYNAFANVDTVVKEDNDTDKMFLMSLLPHLTSIPEENKLNAKTEIMIVLQKANCKKP